MSRIFASRFPAWLLPAGLFVLALLLPDLARAGTFPTIISPVGAPGDYWLGTAGSGAGDFNGDGYDDVVVCRYASSGGSVTGAALIYFGGGSKTDDVPDVTLWGENLVNNENFGISVASAGDFNGDGYDDVIVGASACDLDGTDAGRAYIFFGGATPNATADVTLHGEAANDWLGWSVAGAGDVNNDGYDDVIVGAYGNDAGGAGAGRAYVFLGGLHPNNVADLTLDGAAADDQFGISAAGAGDMNGDGYDDVIVGAPQNDTGAANAGRAYVYFGGAALNDRPDLIFTGGYYNRLGDEVGSAGDFNGDGYDDALVGTGGVVHVYYGGAFGNTTEDVVLAGAVDYFGRSMGRAGNVNGDGYDDVVVGAWHSPGAAYVFYGGPGGSTSGDGEADLILTGEATTESYGYAVAGAGDVNGDGRDDILATGYRNTTGGANAGRFYVYDMGNPPPAASRILGTLPGAAASDLLGTALDGGGDLDGDGYDDWIVGAYANDAGGSSAGRAYIVRGGPAADLVADLTMTGVAASDYFGLSVAVIGDFDGDGRDDWIVGAPQNDFAGANAGRAYLYQGGPILDSSADIALNGAAAGDNFGWSVADAGDVNGDGYDDVVVGAPYNGAGGSVYVYFGGPVLNGTADWTLSSGSPDDQFGHCVAGAGDVNGDGYDDIVVGAHLNDAAGTDAGRAYIYYGGTSPNIIPDRTLVGEAAGDYFGYSVSGAGDMNGDGYADVIVGAHRNDGLAMDAGRAYVYFGGPDGDVVADLVLTGAATGDYFGWSVACAGDVDLDGCSDVIVGARLNDAGGAEAGRAYVYYGGLRSTAADVMLTGEAAGDDFGRAVACAGDTRGDGVADVIVGAAFSDGGGTSSGGATLVDFNRYHVTAPAGGEDWIGGNTETVSWTGAEKADLYLSQDHGATYDLLKENVGGSSSNSTTVTAPNVGTSLAIVKVVPRDVWIAGKDTSDAVFDIVGPISVGPETPGLSFRPPWPNPAGAAVTLGFELPGEAVVTVTVFDAAGREVARPIVRERFAAGRASREWRPAGLAPGVYTVRAQLGDQRRTRRLVWLGGR